MNQLLLIGWRHIQIKYLISMVIFSIPIVLMRYYFGDIGFVIALCIFGHGLSFGLGCGVFEEEFYKGRLSFLWSIPFSRHKIWLFNVMSCLALVFLSILILSSIFLIPPRNENIGVLDLSSIGIVPSLCVFVSFVLYSFSIGLFIAAIFSRMISYIFFTIFYFSILPFVFMYLIFYQGFIPTLWETCSILLSVSFTHFLGAYVLFINRNPFHDNWWKLRKIAFCFILLAASVFLLTFEALGVRARYAPPYYCRAVSHFEVCPDGEKVLVVAPKSLLLDHSYILDKDGHIRADLGQVSTLFGALTWPSFDSSRYILCQKKYLFDPYSFKGTLILYDLIDNISIDIKNLNDQSKDFSHYYKSWSRDGKFLLGEKTEFIENERSKKYLFKQNILTSNVVYTEILPDTFEYYSDIKYLSNDKVLFEPSRYRPVPNAPEPNNCFAIMDIYTRQKEIYPLPENTFTWNLTKDGHTLFYLKRTSFPDHIEYQLLARRLSSKTDTVVIESTKLPRQTLEDLLNHSFDSFNISFSPANHWLYFQSSVGSSNATFIIRIDDNSYLANEISNLSFYSPDESRICLQRTDILYEDTPLEKRVCYFEILEWTGTSFEKIKEFELPDSCHSFEFLGNNHILYLKKGSKQLGIQIYKLWILNIADGTQKPFCSG